MTDTESTHRLTWQVADHDYGVCEVDLFLSLSLDSNTKLTATIPLTQGYCQHCRVASDVMDISYKTITYVRNENEMKIPVSRNNIQKTISVAPIRTTRISTTTSTTSQNIQNFKVHSMHFSFNYAFSFLRNQ